MTKTCETCGDELDPDRDKAGGSYHAKCLPCLRSQAYGRAKAVHQCDCDGQCLVCRSWRAEKREQAKPHLIARLSQSETPNADLDEFR